MGMRARHRLLTALGAGALSLTLAAQALGASTWSDPVNVWTPPVAADHWSVPFGLVAVDDTTAVAGYIRFNQSSTVDDVFVRKTTDNGQTWAAPVQVSIPGAGANDAVMAGLGQFVDIAWSGVRYSRSTDGGATFSDPITLPNGASSYDTAVARGPNGVVAIAWSKSIRRGGTKVFVAVSHDGGLSFATPQLLWTRSISVFPAVAVGDGMIYVAASPDQGTIKLRRSVDGSVWSDAISVGNHHFGAGSARLTLAASGNDAYLAFTRLTATGTAPVYRHTTDLGATWSSRKQLAPAGAGWTPLLAMHDGVVGVTLVTGSETAYRETFDGVHWTTLERVSQQPDYYSYPGGIAHTDRTLILYAYYNQGSYGPDIYVKSRTDS
jgi:hypothetical protein